VSEDRAIIMGSAERAGSEPAESTAKSGIVATNAVASEAVANDPTGTEPVESGEPWRKLHPNGLKVTALYMAGVMIGAGVPAAVGIGSGTSLLVALAFVVPGALLVIGATVGYEAVRLRVTRYRVTDARVEMHTGVLFKTRRSLMRERIRSVDLTANPLERVFGLAKVKVGTGETGSGSGSANEQTLTLDSVARAEADRLRAELLRRAAAAEVGVDGEQRLATWEPGWLKYAPLSFLTPMLAGAAVGGAFQVAEWFGNGGLPVAIVAGLVEEYGAWSVLSLGLIGLLVLGAVASLALQGEAWWGHRLDREPGGTLRVRRGLLVSRSLSLEEERIRGIEIVEPIGVRSAGAGRLDVVAVGLKTEQEGSDLSTLVPAAPLPAVTDAAAAVIGPVDCDLRTHPKTARTRRLRWAAVTVVVLAVAATVPHLRWSLPALLSAAIVLAAVLGSAFAVWTAFDSYRSLGHALTARHLVSRRGSTRRATVHLDRSGIIGWRITQSVFQKRMGLMTLDATTAAGKGHYEVIDADEHEILDFADAAVPDLLRPFLTRSDGLLDLDLPLLRGPGLRDDDAEDTVLELGLAPVGVDGVRKADGVLELTVAPGRTAQIALGVVLPVVLAAHRELLAFEVDREALALYAGDFEVDVVLRVGLGHVHRRRPRLLAEFHGRRGPVHHPVHVAGEVVEQHPRIGPLDSAPAGRQHGHGTPPIVEPTPGGAGWCRGAARLFPAGPEPGHRPSLNGTSGGPSRRPGRRPG
jgi:putative membrane protein